MTAIGWGALLAAGFVVVGCAGGPRPQSSLPSLSSTTLSPAAALEHKACTEIRDARHGQQTAIVQAARDALAASTDPTFLPLEDAFRAVSASATSNGYGAGTHVDYNAEARAEDAEVTACYQATGIDVRTVNGLPATPTTTAAGSAAARSACISLNNAISFGTGTAGETSSLQDLLNYADIAARQSGDWSTFDQDASAVAHEGLQSQFAWVQQAAVELAAACGRSPIGFPVRLPAMPTPTTESLPPSAPSIPR